MSKPNAVQGYKFYKTCRCGGSLQHRYESIEFPQNKYWIYPTKGQVRIFKDSRTVGTYPLGKLEEKLKEYGI